jgi:N6-adenosine-specific RNA methylase IME4/ParB-like chromosome segregation protein Spo0J
METVSKGYEFHAFANVLPLMEGVEQATLESSTRQHGIREPIVLFEGKILDGRNRYRAALKNGFRNEKIPTRVFDPKIDGDPLEFVWDKNANRRHLNEIQRGYAATLMEALRHGGDRKSSGAKEASTRASLAGRAGVGINTLYSCSIVRDRGVPELKQLVSRGIPSVRVAKTIAELTSENQREVLQRAEHRSRGGDVAKLLRVETGKVIQHAQLARISARNRALESVAATFDVLLVDPPWRYDEKVTGNPRAIEAHYPTMSLDEIRALPVSKLAAENAILFLWVTDHHLLAAEDLLKDWGFERRARMVWVKDSFGFGHYVRNMHEFVLVATRGHMPPPPSDCVPPSVIEFPKRGHSVKPPLYETIEKMTPGLTRRIELFARGEPVPGWDAWGNQAPATSRPLS